MKEFTLAQSGMTNYSVQQELAKCRNSNKVYDNEDWRSILITGTVFTLLFNFYLFNGIQQEPCRSLSWVLARFMITKTDNQKQLNSL